MQDETLIPDSFTYYPRKLFGKTTDIKVIEEALDRGDDVLLIGPTGSGKTALVRYYCAKHQKPYCRVSLNGGCTAEDLIGHYILKDHQTVWADGILTKACKYGWNIVLDEINAAPPDVLFLLNSLLDEERILILLSKDGEVVEPHPDFRFIATCNPSEQGYAGTNEMNEALLDRFETTVYLDYSEEVENNILKSHNFDSRTTDAIKKFVFRIRRGYREAELSTPFSTRMLINLIRMYKNKQVPLLLNRFKRSEQNYVNDLLDIYINKMKQE